MTPSELRTLLEVAVHGERAHVEKITIAAAVISEMLALRGMRTTLVGGGAIEFHASEIYVTTDLDLTELRRTWDARRKAARAILERLDPRGLTRPARDPEERAWLEAHGGQPFVEDEAAGRAAREYYRRRYTRPE